MCSICAIADFTTNEKLNPGILAMMGKTMKHRGPDDTGMYLGRNVIMHHNRLAVMDISFALIQFCCQGSQYFRRIHSGTEQITAEADFRRHRGG